MRSRRIVATVSHQLTERFGKGYTRTAIIRMVKVGREFQDEEIVSTLSRHLTWSHFIGGPSMASHISVLLAYSIRCGKYWHGEPSATSGCSVPPTAADALWAPPVHAATGGHRFPYQYFHFARSTTRHRPLIHKNGVFLWTNDHFNHPFVHKIGGKMWMTSP